MPEKNISKNLVNGPLKLILKKVPIPYQHQMDAFNFIKEKNYFALFMEQGTGKSKVIIMKTHYMYCQGLIDRVIIIAPNALKRQWVREQFTEHYPDVFSCCIWENQKSKKFDLAFNNFCSKNHLKIFSINIEAFQSKVIYTYIKKFLNKGEVFIVVDESTIIKNPKAKRTKTIVEGFRNRKYKCILTGTPTPNSPFDLYSQFDFIKNNFFNIPYFYFTHRYGIMLKGTNHKTGKDYETTIDETTYHKIKQMLKSYNKLNNKVFETLSIFFKTSIKNIILINSMEKFYPYKNLNELNKTIDYCTFKIKKSDCLNLPEKIYETLEVELSKEQKEIYIQLQKEMIAEYENVELSILNKLTMFLRLQQITGGNFPYPEVEIKKKIIEDKEDNFLIVNFKNKRIKNNPKLKALKEDLECVSNDTSIIIWAVFIAELELIYEELKDNYKCGLYIGKTSDFDREKIIDDFKHKKIQILILSPALGEKGLNLQISTLHYFYSNDYRADRRLQAEDRSHRIGQKNNVVYKDIICLSSVDQKILSVLKLKESLIDFFRNKPLEKIIY